MKILFINSYLFISYLFNFIDIENTLFYFLIMQIFEMFPCACCGFCVCLFGWFCFFGNSELFPETLSLGIVGGECEFSQIGLEFAPTTCLES